MVRPVDMACFGARFLTLLRRFPNQLHSQSSLVMPAPDAPGVVVFSASHNHHYLMFHDPDGFSNGIYQFGLTEEFFSAIGPHHLGQATPPRNTGLRLALSDGAYRLYGGTENDRIFDSHADDAVEFHWSGKLSLAQRELREAFDALLYLHQSGKSIPVKQTLNYHYFSEVNYIRNQLAVDGPVIVGHRWLRLPDDTVRCLTQFSASVSANSKIHAVMCVDADMALG